MSLAELLYTRHPMPKPSAPSSKPPPAPLSNLPPVVIRTAAHLARRAAARKNP